MRALLPTYAMLKVMLSRSGVLNCRFHSCTFGVVFEGRVATEIETFCGLLRSTWIGPFEGRAPVAVVGSQLVKHCELVCVPSGPCPVKVIRYPFR